MTRVLDRLQALGDEPVVNPRRGKLPAVVVTSAGEWDALAWALITLVVVTVATVVSLNVAGAGFIYAGF